MKMQETVIKSIAKIGDVVAVKLRDDYAMVARVKKVILSDKGTSYIADGNDY